MFVTKCLVLLVLSSKTFGNLEVEFLKNYFRFEGSPKILTSFLCGNKYYQANFQETLYSEGIQGLIINIDTFNDVHYDLEETYPTPDISKYRDIDRIIEDAKRKKLPVEPKVLGVSKSVTTFGPTPLDDSRRNSDQNETLNRLIFPEQLKWESDGNVTNFGLETISEIHPSEHNYYVLDTNCQNFGRVLKIANKCRKFAAPFKWMFLTNNFSEIRSHLQDLHILPDSDVVIAEKSKNNEYLLRDAYKINRNGRVLVKIINKWTPKGFSQNTPRIISKERKNLMGNIIPVSLFLGIDDTIFHLYDFRFPHIDSVTKMSFYACMLMIDYVNGSNLYFITNQYGYKKPNSSKYSDQFGEIQDRRPELGGFVFVVEERYEIGDYMPLNLPTTVAFIFRKPPLSYVSNIFTLPFTRPVWICSLGLMAIISVVIYVNVRVDWKLDSQIGGLEPSFIEIVTLTIGALCMQGSTQDPRSVGGRMAMLFGFIALMFLYVSYSAHIIILLQSTSDPINNLKDLLESPIKLGTEDTSYNRYYFTVQTETIRKSIYEKKIIPKGEPPHFLDIYEGVNKIREGFYAFHLQPGVAYKVISDTFYENEKCGLKSLEYLNMINPWFMVKKNSSYKEIFRVGFRKMGDYGFNSRFKQRIYSKKPACNVGESNFSSIGISDLYGAFMTLVAGGLLSLIILTGEILSETFKIKIKDCKNKKI